MRLLRRRGLVLAILLYSMQAPRAGLGQVRTADQVGGYARPLQPRFERNPRFEPNPEQATRVQIFGVFALAKLAASGFETPTCGYLYYECPRGRETACRYEWAQIENAAANGGCIGFASRRDPASGQLQGNGRVRPIGEPATEPDPYRTGVGNLSVQACNAVCVPEPLDLELECPWPRNLGSGGGAGGNDGGAPAVPAIDAGPRQYHCGAGGTSGAGGETGRRDDAAVSGAGGVPAGRSGGAGGSAGAAGGTGGTGGAGAGGGAGGAAPGADPPTTKSNGCACNVEGLRTPSTALAWLCPLALVRLVRRRPLGRQSQRGGLR